MAALTPRTRTLLDWSIPLAILTIATVIFRTTDIDRAVQANFYSEGAGWRMGSQQPWAWLKAYGTVVPIAIAVAGLIVFVVSFFADRLRSRRWVALYLAVVMVVGPGLIVNDVFKENWGRPRPKDLYEFGGDRAFQPVWGKPIRGAGNAFPSGHAATAFYLFTPFFVLRRRSPGAAVLFLALGLGYGGLMGVARMAQGAHFLSDAIWAGGFVYLTALAFSPLAQKQLT